MNESRPIRLGKFAGEEGIGMAQVISIVELLGIEIDPSPNSKLSPEHIKAYRAFTSLPQNIQDNLIEKLAPPKKQGSSDFTTYEVLKNIREEKGIPKSIFKYYSDLANSIDSVSNNYLYYSSHNSFNDPFDCYNHLVDLKGMGKVDYKTQETIRDAISKKLLGHGICCFSRVNDSILMWSHYGNKHKGFCIEFDYKKMDSPPLDINYVHNFKRIDLLSNLNSMYHLIFTKSNDWEYEQELRSLVELKEGERKINYDPKCIKAVYFGVNASDDLIYEIANSVIEKNPKSKFYRGNLEKNAFEIAWKRLNKNNIQV